MNWQVRAELLQRELDEARETIAQLRRELDNGRTWTPPIELALTGKEGAVLAALHRRSACSKQQIMDALYLDRPNEVPEPKIVDVFICKLRRKLRPFGVEITTLWGRGYSLSDGARARLDQLAAGSAMAA